MRYIPNTKYYIEYVPNDESTRDSPYDVLLDIIKDEDSPIGKKELFSKVERECNTIDDCWSVFPIISDLKENGFVSLTINQKVVFVTRNPHMVPPITHPFGVTDIHKVETY